MKTKLTVLQSTMISLPAEAKIILSKYGTCNAVLNYIDASMKVMWFVSSFGTVILFRAVVIDVAKCGAGIKVNYTIPYNMTEHAIALIFKKDYLP